MGWLLLAGSLAGVLGLGVAAWLLGLGRGRRIAGADEARRLAEEAVEGFAAGEAWVSRDGAGALVAGGAGDFVLLKVHGVQVAARRLARLERLELGGGGVTVPTGELMFGDVRLDLGDAERDRLMAML